MIIIVCSYLQYFIISFPKKREREKRNKHVSFQSGPIATVLFLTLEITVL